MVLLICLIVGSIYAIRLPKLNALTAEQFPHVPQEMFAQWKAAQRNTIIVYLCASWGVLIVGAALFYPLAPVRPRTGLQTLLVELGCLVVYLILLGFSAIPAGKAVKLKQKYGIKWP